MPKNTSLRHDLGIQMLALYMLFIGPVLIGALIFDNFSRKNLENDVQAADLALAHAVALETDAALTNAAHTVVNLATREAVINADPEAMQDIFRGIMLGRSDINLIYRLGPEGVMLYHYPHGPSSTVGVDFSFRRYFQRALQSSGPVFSAGRISPTTGKPVATAVMPLHDDARHFLGVVATNLALDKLSDTLAVIVGDQVQELIVSIVDSRGQVIAYPGLLDTELTPTTLLTVRRGEDVGLPNTLLPDWGEWQDGVVDAVLAGEMGASISTAPDNSRWLRSYVPIPVAGWGVIVQRPTAIAFATIERFHRLLLLAIGIYVLGGVIFWLLLSRRVIVPLEHLAAFSQMVGQRQRTSRDIPTDLVDLARRPDQMGNLTQSLLAMADDIEQRFVELSTLLETSRVVVSSLDAGDVIDSILNEVQRLLNADRTAIVALDERLDVFRIRASQGLSEEYVRQLRIEPSEPYSAAMRALRTQTPVQITDTEQTPDYVKFLPRARQEGFRSLLAVPLLTQHAPPAVLLLYFDQPHRCSEAELELVASFANHAAMAMENASLYARSDAQLQEQTRRLEAIVESLNDGLILEGLEGRVLFCNQRAADLLGVRRSLACRRPTSDLIEQLLATAEDPERAASELQNAIVQGSQRPIDIIRRGADGRPQDLRIYVFEVTDARGKLIGRGQYWQDFTHDKDLDRMKSALLSTVSHELRTPLAAIKGYATTLLAQDVAWDAATQREFIQTISDEADRLASFVSDLLDLSRLEGGALQINREIHPIAEIIRESAARNGQRLDASSQLDLPPDLPPLWIDRPRLETILRNLIENAVKYAPPDSPVVISARHRDDDVIISVRDYGPGVPAEQRDMIFDRFYRGDIERDRRVGGAGLGLAICKGFIEAHGGRIWIEDADPGAVFLFTLPLTAPDPQDVIYDNISAHSGR